MARSPWNPMNYIFSGRHIANTKRNARKSYRRARPRLADEGERFVGGRSRHLKTRRRKASRRRR